jgi:hypothetical protein
MMFKRIRLYRAHKLAERISYLEKCQAGARIMLGEAEAAVDNAHGLTKTSYQLYMRVVTIMEDMECLEQDLSNAKKKLERVLKGIK